MRLERVLLRRSSRKAAEGRLCSRCAVGLQGRTSLAFSSFWGQDGGRARLGRGLGLAQSEKPEQGGGLGAVPLWGPLSGGLAPFAGVCAQGFCFWFPRVEEDLDQILNLGTEPKPQPQPKPKPPVAAKPVLPRKPAVVPRAGPSEAVAGQWKQQQQIDPSRLLAQIAFHTSVPHLFSSSVFQGCGDAIW